jgi:hypothetical protein
MEERRGSGWFGLPAMIGVLAFVAAVSAVHSLIGVVVAGLAVLLVFLIIGAAMTLANKR